MSAFIEVHFDQPETFAAWHAAEKWCSERGISVGRTCAGSPVGLLYGDFDIQKWRNLRKHERAGLDGTIVGNFRNGPLTLRIRDPHADDAYPFKLHANDPA